MPLADGLEPGPPPGVQSRLHARSMTPIGPSAIWGGLAEAPLLSGQWELTGGEVVY